MRRRRGSLIAATMAAAIAVGLAWCTHHGARAPASTHGAAASGSQRGVTHAVGPGRRVAGTVLLDGSAVAGATIRVVGMTGPLGGKRVATDAAGQFDAGVLPRDEYLVVADKPHLTGASVRIDLRDPTADTEHVVLALHACDVTIQGVVRDAAGGPIGGARVAVSGNAAESDAAGNYELCVVPDDITLVASADGYAQDRAYLRVSGRMRRDFLLSPEGTIAGRVVRAADQVPVAGAIVTARTERFDAFNEAPLHAVSDDNGQFRVSGAGIGRYVLTAVADGLTTQRPVPVLAEIGMPEEETVCELVAAASVSGTVVAAEKPIAGARIWLQGMVSDPDAARDAIQLATTTQADGAFVFDHVPPGDYVAFVPDYKQPDMAKSLAVPAAGLHDVKIDVAMLASIAGRVLHGGKPVDGADVRVSGRHVVTDGEGRFVVRGLAAGSYGVYAEARRVGAFTHGPDVVVAEGEQKTGIDVELDLEGSISGKVVDQNGTPVGGVVVSFSLLSGNDYGVATTAEDGSFTATDLSGGGDYAYEVSGGEATSYEPVDRRRFPPIEVKDGHTRVEGVVIKIKRQRLSIAGRVVASGDEPMPDVVVRLAQSDYGFGGGASHTDDAGAFRIEDVPPGHFKLHATSTHGDQLVDVTGGDEHVVIHMPDAASITGSVDGFPEVPDVVAIRNDEPVAIYRASMRGNRFTIRGIPPGTYEVTARSAAGIASEPVTLAERANVTVSLHRKQFGRITATVSDATTHRPVAGMVCGYSGWWTQNQPAISDTTGTARFDHVPAGDTFVWCDGQDARGTATITVVAGETATAAIVAESTARATHGYAGFVLEDQSSDTVIHSVEPGGPADRAGLRAGDILIEVDGVRLTGFFPLAAFEDNAPGTTFSLTIERAAKQQTATLTLARRPTP